jgi:hypothetical protein
MEVNWADPADQLAVDGGDFILMCREDEHCARHLTDVPLAQLPQIDQSIHCATSQLQPVFINGTLCDANVGRV